MFRGKEGGSHKKPIYREELPKKGGGVFGQFADLRGGLGEKEEMVFLRGVGTPVHTMLRNLSKKFDMSVKLFYKQPLKGVSQWSS